MHTASVPQVLGQALGLLVSGLPSCMTGAYVSPSFEDPWNQTGSAPGALGFLRNCSTPDFFFPLEKGLVQYKNTFGIIE